jgi:hypothetical protein
MKCQKWNYIPHKVNISKNNRYKHYRRWFEEYESHLNNMLNITLEIIESSYDMNISFNNEIKIEFLKLIYHSSSKYI